MAQAYSVVPARPLAPAAPADVPILDTPSKRLMQHVTIRVCLLSPSLVFLTFIHVGTVSPSCPHTLRKVPLCVRVCARVCILAYASICASTWAVETHVQSCPRPVSRPPGERMGLDSWPPRSGVERLRGPRPPSWATPRRAQRWRSCGLCPRRPPRFSARTALSPGSSRHRRRCRSHCGRRWTVPGRATFTGRAAGLRLACG